MVQLPGIYNPETANKRFLLRPLIWMGLCLCAGLLMAPGMARAQLSQKGPFQISALSDSVYVFTSYGSFNGQYYPANGLYVLTPKGAVIIDGPWDPKDRLPLLDSIWHRHHQKVVACLATHFHEDRSGALKEYGAIGIPTYATKMTDSLCQLHQMPRPKYLMAADTVFNLGGRRLQTFYPGPGHAPDNIVVWLPKEKILYGGCFIKSISDRNLGNLGDANIQVWAANARKVKKRYPHPRYIIVGHGSWRSLASLDHTIDLVNTALQGTTRKK
ncbi:metallo-beta-lactamase class B [Arachidicoccus rhizosphaerae]|uniref:beta-lactamase n=1 Tax=Arachidicoccus rhizosphaerae TaxID=551991 RepID=A0A1H3ZIN4_9BACT|nr:subclass B1 metallo-beta-lactamase [Arachidicoccus rhizosphaerae]SEA23629.1 metallo-beta-lactamase class B [Arachidicoccus rhizosphaerae]